MSRKLIGTVAVVAITAVLAGPAWAANWALQGSSGFSLPVYPTGAWGMNLTRDYKRIMFNSIAIDGNGYVFATANTLNDNSQPGGVTVYQPDGLGGYTKLRDIDVNATSWPGMITKLMTRRQDGQIYALQNYSEIEWGYATSVPCRILKLQADGTVSLVRDLSAYFVGLGFTAAQSWIEDAEMGPDGHIYFAVNGADGYFKYHYFWRVQLPSGTVQEAIRDTATNEGHGLRRLMWSVKYVGTKNFIDSFTSLHLGGAPQRTANPWAWGFEKINNDPTNNKYWVRPVNPYGDSTPNWGRDRVTALAYDGSRKALWMGVRGPAETYNRWQAYRQTTSENPASGQGWGDLTLDPAYTTGVANIGALTWNKENDRIRWYQPSEYLNDPKFINGLTIAARLKLIDWNAPTYVVAISPSGYANCQGNDTNPWVGVRVNGGNLELWDIKANALLKNVGTFSNNTWMEIRLFGTAYQNQDRVKCWINGTLQYDSAVDNPKPVLTPANWMYTGVGTGVGGDQGAAPVIQRTGTGRIVIDWLGYHLGEYTGDAATWANELPDTDTPVGSFQPCHVLPHYWLYTAIMTRWVGTDSEPSLYSGVGIAGQNPDPMPGLTRMDHWHCNGNDPVASNKSTGSPYWVQALAVNPCDGSAYMSWSAYLVNQYHGDTSRFAWGYYLDDSVSPYASLGKVYRIGFYDAGVNPSDPETDQGSMPGAGANSVVAALAFTSSGQTVLAHVIDSTDRTYKLYAAPNPNGGYCCNDPFADVVPTGGDGMVDMNDFAAWQRCYNDDPNDFDPACSCFDRNGDNRVNGQDLISFINCASAPGVEADKNCDGF